MTPFLNDLEWPNSRSCFRFLTIFRAKLPQSVHVWDRSLPNFRIIGSRADSADCCEIGLLSLKRRWRGNNFLFIQSTQFFRHSDQRVINIVHSATTRSTVVGVIHEVDRRRFLLTTPIYRITDIFPGHFPLRHFLDTRVRRNTTRSASAALDAREPINWPINDN